MTTTTRDASTPRAFRFRRIIAIVGCVVGAIILSTGLGLLTGWTFVLLAPALVTIGFLLAVFAFADAVLRGLKRLQDELRDQRHALLRTLYALSRLPLQTAILVRATAFGAAQWTCDFYIAALTGDFSTFVAHVPMSAFVSISAVVLALPDTIGGRTLRDPSILTRVMSVAGFFAFYRNMAILAVADRPDGLIAVNALLSNPLWFLDGASPRKGQILSWSMSLYPPWNLVVFVLLPIGLILVSRYSLRVPEKDKVFDRHNVDIAIIILAAWVLPLAARGETGFQRADLAEGVSRDRHTLRH
jgi:hypothetical protein